MTILLRMFLPATRLPTGGVTHVFEAITVLLAPQLLVGRRTIWLPARLRGGDGCREWRAMDVGEVKAHLGRAYGGVIA